MKRLFVPLSLEPFKWFERGLKSRELRRAAGAYRPDRLVAGREVELRLGYSGKRRITGRIGFIVEGMTIADVLAGCRYQDVIPAATSRDDAIAQAERILGGKPGPFVAFEIITSIN